jgi:hypothetical protein
MRQDNSFRILVDREWVGIAGIADIARDRRNLKNPPPRAAVPHEPSEPYAN